MPTTENITVLFTDLVGSTELSASLSPEASDNVRRKHFSALRQAIATSGGTEVKNLGDGLMVVFPVASAALSCAVAMQQAVHRDNAKAERFLGLRVALSAGEATKEDGDYFGEPVVEAARLCGRAEGGQVLVASVVRAMAGRRSPHTFTPLGELELKGLPEPIETLQVSWVPLTEEEATSSGSVPLPARLAHRPAVGVVGREEELASLSATAKRVASGEGREMLLITGEPGQGKTTLVSEIARRAHEDGMIVLLGRCDEDVGSPYRPFHEALTHYVAHAEEDLLRTHVSAHGGELGRLVPALQQRLGDLPSPQSTDPDTERYLLYAAAVGLLELASVQTPVLLVLDDLHWVDKPSLQLLRHIVANTSTARLLIFGTYRDAELSAAHPLTEALAALHREPSGISSIDLKGLDDTGVIAFMESAAGHALDDAGVGLAHDLYRETDGNPFFVAEVLRSLSESGAIVQDATGRWTAPDTEGQLALPNSVRTVIGTRVSRLGEEATKILSAASVIGRDFHLDLLAATTGVDEDDLIDLLEQAQRAAVVTDLPGTPGRYSFSHALIQHTLYEDMAVNRRTRVHKAVGEAIEHLYGQHNDARLGELARHFLLATRPTDADKAMSYAARAGDAALAALAPDDAVRYFTQALELASQTEKVEPTVRIDLLIGLGTAQRQAGIPDFRTTLLNAALQAQREGDSARLASAALANNRGFFSSLGEVDSEKVDVLGAALELLPDKDSPERARLLATLCSELIYDSPLERRLELADQAKSMARRIGDKMTLVDVISRCSDAIQAPSTLSGDLADLAEAIAVARDLDEPVRRFFAEGGLGYSRAVRAGQFDLAAERLSVACDIADRVRQPAVSWIAAYKKAAQALLHGETTRAESLASEALEIGTACGQPDALTFFGVQLMAIRYLEGRIGELVPLIADVVDKNPAIPTFRAVLASAQLDAGDEESARALLDEAATTLFSLREDNTWMDGMANFARVAIELALHEHSGKLLELLGPYSDQVPEDGLIPLEPVSMFLGGLATVLARYDDADRYFEEAAELNERGQMMFAEAHTNVLWGRMLRQHGQPGDADRTRTLLEQARANAAAQGYARVERQAAEELSKLT